MSFTHVAGRRNTLGKTWIDPEEKAYSADTGKGVNLKNSARKGYVRFPDGKLRTVTLGVADTFFTIPARASNSRHGHVYVADFRNGEWIPESKREFTFAYYHRTPEVSN